MTDYDYNDNRVTLDDNDSSKNGARDIGGYDLTVTPDQNWPGIGGAKNQRYDVEKMRTVANQINNWIIGLNDNLVGQISSRVSGVSFGDPSWVAAQNLSKANNGVATTIEKFTTQLVQSLTAARDAIKSAADTYENAEKANKKSGDSQQSSLDEI